jgi:hypothetical protein
MSKGQCNRGHWARVTVLEKGKAFPQTVLDHPKAYKFRTRLAYMEIRTAIAMVLWYFEFKICEECSNWIAEQSYNIVWNRGPLYVKLRKRVELNELVQLNIR